VSDKPRKQEQEDASEEITEVAPGVLRLQLPIQFTGLGHVNCYALEDENGFALVDPGLPGPTSWAALFATLERAEIPVQRVHTVVVTHSHPDHFGGAGRLHAESGAGVVTHRSFRTLWDPSEDAEALDDHDDDEAFDREPLKRRFGLPPAPWDVRTPWGGRHPRPPRKFRAMWHFRRLLPRQFRTPEPTHLLDDADTIKLARREWVALHTPGHTGDHLCLFDPEEGVLLSGDHVLPTITPHISGISRADALADFFESLDRVASLEGMRVVLPAHGHPFTDLSGRVEDIKRHHAERLDVLRAASAQIGAASVEEYSTHLFKARQQGAMADAETYAHLEHLRRTGEAERRRQGERLVYLIGS
jgi:glyoxylase-like metal-dependent hydrolase (beta-lactamase superfamily II)